MIKFKEGENLVVPYGKTRSFRYQNHPVSCARTSAIYSDNHKEFINTSEIKRLQCYDGWNLPYCDHCTVLYSTVQCFTIDLYVTYDSQSPPVSLYRID